MPWTNGGVGVALGVTAFVGADAGLVPTALVAVTVNVYGVPLVRPDTVAVVGAGVPLTVVVGWATPLAYGVTV